MYVAMNRFRIAGGREDEFTRVWRERDSYLDGVAGFRRFRLLQGERRDGETTFVSHSEWDSRAAFEAWTNSEAFTKAHRSGRTPEGLVLAHPQFEGYEVVVS
jgi:heme-degrading monooxygenase HmoA